MPKPFSDYVDPKVVIVKSLCRVLRHVRKRGGPQPKRAKESDLTSRVLLSPAAMKNRLETVETGRNRLFQVFVAVWGGQEIGRHTQHLGKILRNPCNPVAFAHRAYTSAHAY